ncbi:MAG: hypothetical protein ACK559_34470, partial [bacterium]
QAQRGEGPPATVRERDQGPGHHREQRQVELRAEQLREHRGGGEGPEAGPRAAQPLGEGHEAHGEGDPDRQASEAHRPDRGAERGQPEAHPVEPHGRMRVIRDAAGPLGGHGPVAEADAEGIGQSPSGDEGWPALRHDQRLGHPPEQAVFDERGVAEAEDHGRRDQGRDDPRRRAGAGDGRRRRGRHPRSVAGGRTLARAPARRSPRPRWRVTCPAARSAPSRRPPPARPLRRARARGPVGGPSSRG